MTKEMERSGLKD